jgi:hypothetical protein
MDVDNRFDKINRIILSKEPRKNPSKEQNQRKYVDTSTQAKIYETVCLRLRKLLIF